MKERIYGTQLTFKVNDVLYKKLFDIAKERSASIASVARSLILAQLKEKTDEQTVTLKVDDDVLNYVRAKKFGSVESFATWAMECTMQRNQLTEGQKARIGK